MGFKKKEAQWLVGWLIAKIYRDFSFVVLCCSNDKW